MTHLLKTKKRNQSSEPLVKKEKICTFSYNRIFSYVTFALVLISMLVIISSPASAADYFAATSGSDSNPGTLDKPWRSVSYATNQLCPGDTLYLINGTWKDEHIVFSKSGTLNKSIRLMKYNGTVVLDGVDQTGVGIYAKNKSNLRIDGIDIRNYQIAMNFIDNSSDIEISNFTVTDVKQSGVEFDSYTGGSSVFNVSIHDFNVFRFGGQPGKYCGGVIHELGFVNSHDIEIYNFNIKDAYERGAGIRFRFVNSLHIHDGEIYNTAPSYDGIWWGQNVNNSLIENITINNSGWHGIGLQGGDTNKITPEQYLYNNTIRNCTIGYPKHNAIDVHTGNVNTTIENVVMYGLPEGLAGINYMWNASDLTVKNVEICGLSKGMVLLQPNASIWDCVIHDIEWSSIYVTAPNIDINNCDLSNTEYTTTVWIGNNADNYVVNNTRIGEGRSVSVTAGKGILRDMIDKNYVINARNASVTIEYTDGKAFSITDSPYLSVPLWTNRGSYATYNVPATATSIKVTSYPITVKPSNEPVKIKVNKFNTSLPAGNVLVDITVDSANNNNIVFSVGELKPENYYLVKKGGIEYISLKADSSGYIQFKNSDWSNQSLTVEEAPAIFDEAPIADAGPDIKTIINSEVTFNGSNSTDDKGIISYTWDFDWSDGIQIDAIGAIVKHTYSVAGKYKATLTVTDISGNSNSDTVNVTVRDPSIDKKLVITSYSPENENLQINEPLVFRVNTS